MKTLIRILQQFLLFAFSAAASFAQWIGDCRSAGNGNRTTLSIRQQYNGSSRVFPTTKRYPGQNAGTNAAVNIQSGDNVITISGTPTASGPFNYSIPLTGGCKSPNATRTIPISTPMPQTSNGATPLGINATGTCTSATAGGIWKGSTTLYFYCVRS